MTNEELNTKIELCGIKQKVLTEEEPARILGFVACVGISVLIAMLLTDLKTLFH